MKHRGNSQSIFSKYLLSKSENVKLKMHFSLVETANQENKYY